LSAGEAQFLLDSETVKEIFAQLERDAIETAIGAKLGDDECRGPSFNLTSKGC